MLSKIILPQSDRIPFTRSCPIISYPLYTHNIQCTIPKNKNYCLCNLLREYNWAHFQSILTLIPWTITCHWPCSFNPFSLTYLVCLEALNIDVPFSRHINLTFFNSSVSYPLNVDASLILILDLLSLSSLVSSSKVLFFQLGSVVLQSNLKSFFRKHISIHVADKLLISAKSLDQ